MQFGDLRGILQYVPQFRGRTFVIALDGEVLASNSFSNFLLDLAVLRSLNVKVVLVHGASCQVAELAKTRGVGISNDDGTGVTDAATLDLSIDAITRLGDTLMQSLTAQKIRAAMANAVMAHPAGIVKGIDRQFTGTIERIDTPTLEGFLKQDILPLVAPLGYEGRGRTLRLNSDSVAVEVALALKAAKIIYVSASEADFGLTPQISRQLSQQQAEEVLHRIEADNVTPSGQVSKLRHAIRACEEGVPRVHLVNSRRDDALLAELFSNEGVGTMVFSDAYQRVRDAQPEDVDEMILMMRKAMTDEQLVVRSREDIVDRLNDFSVIEIDGNVVGCVALHAYDDDDDDGSDRERRIGELACLFIKRDHEGQQYGRRLIEEVERRAREQGMSELFALSTQAADYFVEKMGYQREKDSSRMPEERRRRCEESARNAVILFKEL